MSASFRIHPLAGCEEKLRGAREQHVTLKEQWESFLDKEPYSLTFQSRTETPHHITVIAQPLEPPPLALAVTLGGLVHNLRSALDHLVCRFRDPQSLRDDLPNAFPIYVSKSEFEGQFLLPGKKKGRPRDLEGITPKGPEWTLIERSQPYQSGGRPEEHPLWVLRCLSNRDKHRILNAALGYPDPPNFRRSLTWNQAAILKCYKPLGGLGQTVVGDTPLAELWFEPSGAVPDMYVEGKLPFEPAFDYGERIVTEAGIEKIIEVVETILELARPLF